MIAACETLGSLGDFFLMCGLHIGYFIGLVITTRFQVNDEFGGEYCFTDLCFLVNYFAVICHYFVMGTFHYFIDYLDLLIGLSIWNI